MWQNFHFTFFVKIWFHNYLLQFQMSFWLHHLLIRNPYSTFFWCISSLILLWREISRKLISTCVICLQKTDKTVIVSYVLYHDERYMCYGNHLIVFCILMIFLIDTNAVFTRYIMPHVQTMTKFLNFLEMKFITRGETGAVCLD